MGPQWRVAARACPSAHGAAQRGVSGCAPGGRGAGREHRATRSAWPSTSSLRGARGGRRPRTRPGVVGLRRVPAAPGAWGARGGGPARCRRRARRPATPRPGTRAWSLVRRQRPPRRTCVLSTEPWAVCARASPVTAASAFIPAPPGEGRRGSRFQTSLGPRGTPVRKRCKGRRGPKRDGEGRRARITILRRSGGVASRPTKTGSGAALSQPQPPCYPCGGAP